MVKNVAKYFTDLGLKSTEVKVYLACLQKPSGLFVHQIVGKTRIRRSTLDLILDRLRRQGFVSRHKEGARWVYSAESPERISFSLEQKLENFQGILPILAKVASEGQMPTVRFFEDSEGIEQAFEDVLLTCRTLPQKEKELLIISSGQNLIRLLPLHEKHFIRKRIKLGIPVKIIAPLDRTTEALYASGDARLRQTRFFDGKAHPFKIEINIYGDKIALLNFEEPAVNATIIENRLIAQSMRALFAMLWAAHPQ